MFRTFLALGASLMIGTAYGQVRQQAQVAKSDSVLHVGDSITAAADILRDARVEFDEGGLALANVPKEVGFLNCTLDKQRTRVVLFYSKSTKRITSMNVIVFPGQRSPRADQVWLSAKCVQVNADGSYAIQFLPEPEPLPNPVASSKPN